MKINVVAGDIAQQDVGAVVVNLFEGVTAPAGATGAVDRAMGGAISALIADGEIKGKRGEITVIHYAGDDCAEASASCRAGQVGVVYAGWGTERGGE